MGIILIALKFIARDFPKSFVEFELLNAGEQRSGGLAMRGAFAFSICLIVTGCGASETEGSEDALSYDYTAPPVEPVSDEVPWEEPRQTEYRPSHHYDAREGVIYSYIAAISEDDRKAGKAAGDVVSFAYLGMRDGKHVLARVRPNGSVMDEAYCGQPCRVISYADGSQLAFNESSIIGAAFADAIAGKLAIANYVSPPPRSSPTPLPTPSSDASSASPAPGWTPKEAELISGWMQANENCRGGTDPKKVEDACANRDGIFSPALAAQNICYGRRGEFAYQYVMHRCGDDSVSLGE